jgi:16S rRNA (adenine1518-N6/adenine1519-N6)-dimethyltransferase
MREKLGQHFLIDKKALEKIASGLDIKTNDTVIEIGPGHGELTKEFRIKNLESGIIAIEKDKELAENLKKEFAHDKNIEIIEGDALEILPSITKSQTINSKSYKLAGNIPYYITGYLFRIIEKLENKPSLIVFTIQKEVAERICAEPPKMNLMAASVQVWAAPEISSIIGRKSFSPPPEVDSATIKLVPKEKRKNLESYYKLAKILFKQPRKTILNNLASGLEKPKTEIEEVLKKLNIKPTDRPQNLSIRKIEALSAEF